MVLYYYYCCYNLLFYKFYTVARYRNPNFFFFKFDYSVFIRPYLFFRRVLIIIYSCIIIKFVIIFTINLA